MCNRKFIDVVTCLFENPRLELSKVDHIRLTPESPTHCQNPRSKNKKPGTCCDLIADHLRQPGQLMFTGGSASEARPLLTTTTTRPDAP